MKRIDRYIFGNYIQTFLFVALIFTMISMVFDFSAKVKDFMEESIPLYEIIFHHYCTYIPYINGQLFPLYALITVIFFTSRLAGNSEIISILGAGVSFERFMLPYIWAAALIGGVHLLGNHYLIPEGNKLRLGFEHKYIYPESDGGRMKDVHLFIDSETKIFVRYYSKSDTSARDFRLERFEEDKLVYLLKANKAEWLGEPNRWRLHNYEVRTFDGLEETFHRARNEKMDTTLNLYPKDFIYYDNQRQGMTSWEMIRFMQRERERGIGNTEVYEIELHQRSANPFTIFILTIMGVAIASRKVRGGMGLNLAIGILVGAGYIFLSRMTTTFALAETIPVMLGVWLPNILFAVVAIILVSRAQK